MPKLTLIDSGEEVWVSQSSLSSALATGAYVEDPDMMLSTIDSRGNRTSTTLSDLEYQKEYKNVSLESDESLSRASVARQHEEDFGGSLRTAKTFGRNLASGATFGLSEFIMKGDEADQDIKNIENRINPTAAVAGQLVGAVAPALIPGGGILSATKATTGLGKAASIGSKILRSTPAGAAARVAEGVAARVASKGLAKRAVAKGLAYGAEGSLHGASQVISKLALNEDVELNGDLITSELIPSMLKGAALGAAAGAGLEVLGAAGKLASSKIKSLSALGDKVVRAEAKIVKSMGNKMKKIVGDVDSYSRSAAADSLKVSDLTLSASGLIDDVVSNPKFSGLIDDAMMKRLDTFQDSLMDVSMKRSSLGSAADGVVTEADIISSWTTKSGKIDEALIKKSYDEMYEYGKNMQELKIDLDSLGVDTKALNGHFIELDNPLSKMLTTVEGIDTVGEFLGIDVPTPGDLPYVGEFLKFMLVTRLSKDAAGIVKLTNIAAKVKDIPLINKVPIVSKALRSAETVSRITSKLDGVGKKLSKTLSKISDPASLASKKISRVIHIPAIEILNKSATLDSLSASREGSDRKLPGNQSDMIDSFRSESRNSDKTLKSFKANIKGLINAVPSDVANAAVHATLGDEALEFPELATSIHSAQKRKIEFLQSKVPKDPMSNYTMGDSGWKPTKQELMKFSRYIKALDEPTSLISDVMSNNGSAEAAEAVRVVYPALYAKMQVMVAETIMEMGATNISRNIRLGIAATLDIPVDPTTTAEFLVQMSSLQSQTPMETPTGTTNRQVTGPRGAPQKLTSGVDMGEETSIDRIGGK